MERTCCYPVYPPRVHDLKLQLGWSHASFFFPLHWKDLIANVGERGKKIGHLKKSLSVLEDSVSIWGRKGSSLEAGDGIRYKEFHIDQP